jgi:hypothetical protein
MLVVLMVGCGGGLDPGFAGTWGGDLYFSYQRQQFIFPGPLVVSVTGDSAKLGRVCPDGTGSLAATGSGLAVTWSGSMTCNAAAIGSCSSVLMTYTSAGASLSLPMDGSGDPTILVFGGTGTGAGCGLSGPFTVSLFGTP